MARFAALRILVCAGFLLKDINMFKNVGIDYAFTNLANQSNPLYTHIVSLRLDLINTKRQKDLK